MKWLDYLFFNAYNWFYKDGYNKKNDIPYNSAGIALATGFMLWAMLVGALYSEIILNKLMFEIPKYSWALIGLIFYAIIYFSYIENKKYEKVYDTYKHLDKSQRTRGFVVVMIFMLLPAILIGVFTIIKSIQLGIH